MLNRKQFFDMHASKWETYYEKRVKNKISKYILPALGIKKSDKILDVGSGTGIMLPFLKKAAGKNGEVVALDFSGLMLKKAKEKYGDAFKYIRSNAQKTPFKTGYFDVIVCFSVFPHFINKQKTLKEMCRILKESGRLIIAHADSRHTINNHHRKIGTVVANDTIPDNDKILLMMKKAGFTGNTIKEEKACYIAKGFKALA